MSEGIAVAHILIALAYFVIGVILGTQYVQPQHQTLTRSALFTFFWGCGMTHVGLAVHALSGTALDFTAWHHYVPAAMQVIGAPVFIWAMWPYLPTILAPARVDSLTDIPLVISGGGRISEVNSPACELLGYEDGELVGRPLNTLIPQRFRKAHDHFRAGYMKSPRARPMGEGAELWIVAKDGTEMKVRIGLAPVSKDQVAAAILHIQG